MKLLYLRRDSTLFNSVRQVQSNSRLFLALSCLLAGVLVFILRIINLGPSFNIFIDEITYLHLSQQAVQTMKTVLYGKTFYLHPPAYFFMQGTFLSLTQPGGTLVDQIYVARVLNVAFAAISGVSILVIVQRIAGWKATVAAVTLFALDPFIIRMNSLMLLDTPAIAWVLLGYALLYSSLPLPGTLPIPTRLPVGLGRAIAAGVCFGLAVLTKDAMVFLTIVPLLLCFALDWALARRTTLLIAATTFLVYLPYPIIVTLSGDWARFSEQKFQGLRRLAGFVKITGLNRTDGPSLFERVIERLPDFGPTYIVIALCIVALVVLLVYRVPATRLLTAWLIGTVGIMGYCVLFGTIEEQFFYWIVASGVPAVVVAAQILWVTDLPLLARHSVRSGTLVIALVLVSWGSIEWAQVHLTSDNGYEQVLNYLADQPDATVASTSETGQFLLAPLRKTSGPWGNWTNPEALAEYDPDYLLINLLQIDWHQQSATEMITTWAAQHGDLVFAFDSPREDSLLLYRLHTRP